MKFSFKREIKWGDEVWMEESDDPGHWGVNALRSILGYLALRTLGVHWNDNNALRDGVLYNSKTWEEVLNDKGETHGTKRN